MQHPTMRQTSAHIGVPTSSSSLRLFRMSLRGTSPRASLSVSFSPLPTSTGGAGYTCCFACLISGRRLPPTSLPVATASSRIARAGSAAIVPIAASINFLNSIANQRHPLTPKHQPGPNHLLQIQALREFLSEFPLTHNLGTRK